MKDEFCSHCAEILGKREEEREAFSRLIEKRLREEYDAARRSTPRPRSMVKKTLLEKFLSMLTFWRNRRDADR